MNDPFTGPQRINNLDARPSFEVVTFDCYGTLIDWGSGILEAFQHAMNSVDARSVSTANFIELYDEEERKVEKEEPYKSYREVQSLAVRAVARKVGWKIANSGFLSEELPKWRPFPDTNPGLERLAKRHILGILSNVDNDLLASTLTHFTVPFQIIITAEEVKSYKPSLGHFRAARKMIGTRTWLHVAGSLYHDIEPATMIGVPAVWVNRSSPKTQPTALSRNVKNVGNLTELADWLYT